MYDTYVDTYLSAFLFFIKLCLESDFSPFDVKYEKEISRDTIILSSKEQAVQKPTFLFSS